MAFAPAEAQELAARRVLSAGAQGRAHLGKGSKEPDQTVDKLGGLSPVNWRHTGEADDGEDPGVTTDEATDTVEFSFYRHFDFSDCLVFSAVTSRIDVKKRFFSNYFQSPPKWRSALR